MTTIESQITSLTVVHSTVYSDTDQRKHQNSASLAFVWGIHRGGEFPAQRASYAENVSIWWRHYALISNGRSSYPQSHIDCDENKNFDAKRTGQLSYRIKLPKREVIS